MHVCVKVEVGIKKKKKRSELLSIYNVRNHELDYSANKKYV